jgi:hypothetical protein
MHDMMWYEHVKLTRKCTTSTSKTLVNDTTI